MPVNLRKAAKWGHKHLLPGFVSRPLDPRLGNRIIRLEGQKTDFNLLEMRDTHAISYGAWRGLGSIAYEIVTYFQPRVVVELGSHAGFSTFAMGLALRDLGRSGTLYAVDTWRGDSHAGHYGEEVYEAFLEDRRRLDLENTVVPLRATFKEASRIIEPGIDLLHIDGWHTHSAVRDDFRQFRPLLNRRAIVMFHDVRTHFRGMRFFWALTRTRYESFRIPYAHGLGIIRMP